MLVRLSLFFFELGKFTTSGTKLTLINGKSLKCTNPLQVIIRVEAKKESTTGDCSITIKQRSARIMNS